MNGRVLAGVAIGVAAVIAGIMMAYNLTDAFDDPPEPQEQEVWNTAGNFGINKHTYKLGEDVFFAGRMAPDQQAIVTVASPEGKVILQRLYNGIDRELVKFYFKPDTSPHNGIYKKDQLLGQWMIWFDGIPNDEIYFTIIDEFVPGAESDIVDLPMPGEREQNLITVERPPPPP